MTAQKIQITYLPTKAITLSAQEIECEILRSETSSTLVVVPCSGFRTDGRCQYMSTHCMCVLDSPEKEIDADIMTYGKHSFASVCNAWASRSLSFCLASSSTTLGGKRNDN